MTLAELHERIGWQLEGRLQCNHGAKLWYDWKDECGIPQICDSAAAFRRRPDPPPMPYEFWLPSHDMLKLVVPAATREECKARWPNASECVRYVRAGAIIPASQIEVRQSNGAWVEPHHTNEYRIKP